MPRPTTQRTAPRSTLTSASRLSPVAGGDDAHGGEHGPDTAAALLEAFIELTAAHGYHATSVREIARRANVSVAALYHHYPSKHDMLYEFMTGAVDDLTGRLEAALRAADPEPRARLRVAVGLYVYRHASHRTRSLVAGTELRSLHPEARADIVAKRDAIEGTFRRIIEAGVERGQFCTPDPAEAARAILTMGAGVASWFDETGRYTADDIAERYVALALALVEATSPSGSPPARGRRARS